ncbi:MAG: DUF983 domain-containing protein [Candidatus Synoicihabitans palmerolidicus]|nr:DUF983 domain-containing protein [Candidatus Synoicihabitans palmerolidicus]
MEPTTPHESPRKQVTRGQIVARGLSNRCPNCGERTLFKPGQWFELNKTCPTCELPIERDEGFFLGSMSLNYGVTIGLFLVPILLWYLAGGISGMVVSMMAGLGAILFPILFYRASRSWWLMNYYFVVPHHLPVNQRELAEDEDANT